MEVPTMEKLPDRIFGLKKLEDHFNLRGYLICHFTGEKIYDMEKVAAIFTPLSSTMEQVVAVHTDHATEYFRNQLLFLNSIS